MSFSCSRGVRCTCSSLETSVNLARDYGYLAVERLLRDAPEGNQTARDVATVLTERPDNKAMRRKSADAPYYHRRTERLGQFPELFFNASPRAFVGPYAADIER
jgi:hypothetical protein